MNAEIKSLINAWFSLLADFLRFFKNEELDKIADEIDAKLAEDAE